jgi:hypothetical protein
MARLEAVDVAIGAQRSRVTRPDDLRLLLTMLAERGGGAAAAESDAGAGGGQRGLALFPYCDTLSSQPHALAAAAKPPKGLLRLPKAWKEAFLGEGARPAWWPVAAAARLMWSDRVHLNHPCVCLVALCPCPHRPRQLFGPCHSL